MSKELEYRMELGVSKARDQSYCGKIEKHHISTIVLRGRFKGIKQGFTAIKESARIDRHLGVPYQGTGEFKGKNRDLRTKCHGD